MHRVLARNGLALPANHTAEVRQAAGARKQAFTDPPTRRNRLWQADFSEFETSGAGTWNLGGVVDYWAKRPGRGRERALQNRTDPRSRPRGRGGPSTTSNSPPSAWVHWYNTARIHSRLNDLSPDEYEAAYTATTTDHNKTKNHNIQPAQNPG